MKNLFEQMTDYLEGGRGLGGTPIYSLGGGVPLGLRKSYPLLYQNFANFVTLYQTKNAQLFLISVLWAILLKCDPILDQFSMITRPYTRPNGFQNHTLSSGTYLPL